MHNQQPAIPSTLLPAGQAFDGQGGRSLVAAMKQANEYREQLLEAQAALAASQQQAAHHHARADAQQRRAEKAEAALDAALTPAAKKAAKDAADRPATIIISFLALLVSAAFSMLHLASLARQVEVGAAILAGGVIAGMSAWTLSHAVSQEKS